jgi:predicted Zn-dependent peptidase
VYEEKNMSLDRDGSKAWESLYAGLFKKHTYGTQTTLGSVEHLKNPSIKALKDYYGQRYVPNNMAIVLSGDFNPDTIIAKIDREFGSIPQGKLQDWKVVVEDPILKSEIREVIGPDAESVMIGFRLGGAKSPDVDMLRLISEMLSNGKAGLIDLNINLAQKAMGAGTFMDIGADYSTFILYGSPKTGQSLDEVRDLLLAQLRLIESGDFPEWLMPAAISNQKLDHLKSMEKTDSRALAIADVFVQDASYEDFVNQFDRQSTIIPLGIQKFARQILNSNYVAVYKKTGIPTETEKIEKPVITPVDLNRTAESEFLTNIRNSKPKPVEPVFVDFKKEILVQNASGGIKVYSVKNTTNELFDLSFRFDMGSQNDLKLAIATQYLPFLGTVSMSPEQLKQEFFKLACDYDVRVNDREITINLSGLSSNMEAALVLFESIITNPQPNQTKLDNLIEDILKARADAKLNKRSILGAMIQYAQYGPKSAFTNVLSENELRNLKADELTTLIRGLSGFQHEVFYYGDKPAAEVVSILRKNHKVPMTLKPVPATVKYPMLDVVESQVYVVDYEMKQVDIALVSKSGIYSPLDVPVVSMFNEYFGNIVFQDIREAKALAYTATGSYNSSRYKGENNSLFGYVGTQNDKLPEAMKGMFELYNNMPEATNSFLGDKNGLLSKIRTERIPKSGILKQYITNRKLGIDYDVRRDVYEKVNSMKFSDIKAFSDKNLKNKKFRICILGKSEQLNMDVLSKYGKITTLKLEDIFGY